MPRSVWKGPFVDGNLLKKAEDARASGRKTVIKTWSCRSTILPQFVGVAFPLWFYSTISIAGVVPLVKQPLTSDERRRGVVPDARPVIPQEVDFRAIGTTVTVTGLFKPVRARLLHGLRSTTQGLV